jgi:hypothetical protein
MYGNRGNFDGVVMGTDIGISRIVDVVETTGKSFWDCSTLSNAEKVVFNFEESFGMGNTEITNALSVTLLLRCVSIS